MSRFKTTQIRPKKSEMVYGEERLLAALNSGQSFNKIFIDSSAVGKNLAIIKKIAAERIIPISYVPTAKIDGFNITGHEGVVGLISYIKYYEVQQIIDWKIEQGHTPFFLMLDGITDIRNIGGICRTAYCCGVDAIIIPDKGVGLLNEEAILTSAGALEKIAVCRVNSLLKTVDELRLNGIKVVVTQMQADRVFTATDFTGPVAIVLGSENNGIQQPLLKASDETIKIPMKQGFESLNVSVATGIILYEAFKQRGEF